MTSFGYAYTGAINSRIHLARHEPYVIRSLCGIWVQGVTEYRPSQEQLTKQLCPACKREAVKLNIDPLALGWRNEADGL